MKRRFEIGKILGVLGSMLLGFSGIGVLGFFLGDRHNVIIDIVSFVLLAVGIVIVSVGFVLCFVKSKEEKQTIKKYLDIAYSPIEDYKAELDKTRANFATDTSNDKNIIIKANFINSKPAYDFSVIKTGNIYYGYLVQANNKLFKDSADLVLPAVVVYSTDAYYEENPLQLKKIANKLFSNRNNNILKDEHRYFWNVKVVGEITGGRDVYMTTFMAYRGHLPLNYLTDGLFPIIANPESSSSVFIVDVKYWTDKLISGFINGAAWNEN